MHHAANSDISALPLEALNIRTDCALRFDVDAPYLHAELIGIDRPVVWVGPDGYEVGHRIEWGPTTGEVAVLPTADFGGVKRWHVFAGGGADFTSTDFSVLPSDTVVSCINDSEPRVTSMTIVVDTSLGSSDLQDIAIPLRDDVAYDMEVLWNPGTSPSFAETTRIDGQLDPVTIEGVELTPFRPVQHTYDDVYRGQIKIAGRMPRWAYANQPDAIDGTAVSRKDALIAVERWADLEWDSVTNSFASAFFGCSELITTGASVFFDEGAGAWFADQLLEGYRPAPVGSMGFCFRDCTSYGATGDACGIGGWDVSSVTVMRAMFRGTPFNQDISGWDVSSVTVMQAMFMGTPFNQDISSWDVSNLTDATVMFRNAANFNLGQPAGEPLTTDGQPLAGDYSNLDPWDWDVSNVSGFNRMFEGCSAFNQDIRGWDVSSGTGDIQVIFLGTVLFNCGLPPGEEHADGWDWNVSGFNGSWRRPNNGIFRGCSAFNQDISSWDVAPSNITPSDRLGEFLYECSSFDQDLGDYDMTNKGSTRFMFRNSGMSDANASATLAGWADPTRPHGNDLQDLIDAMNAGTVSFGSFFIGAGVTLTQDALDVAIAICNNGGDVNGAENFDSDTCSEV